MKIINLNKYIILCLGIIFYSNLEADVLSTNSGHIPNTDIRYCATMEIFDGKLNMRFVFTNESKTACHMHKGSLHIPGNMALFISRDLAQLNSDNEIWLNEFIPDGGFGATGTQTIAPESSIEILLPLGDYYSKIYRELKKTNVYVYWGITVEVADDTVALMIKEKRKIVKPKIIPLSRIGGMLSIPKGADCAAEKLKPYTR